MRKIISILVASVMVFSLCSCKEIEKSEEVVNGFFAAITSDDKEGLAQYIAHSEDEVADGENNDNNDDNVLNDYGQDFWNAFSKITYEIKSAEIDENDKKKVNVVTDVQAVDLATLYQNAVTEAIQAAFANIFAVEDNIDVSDEAFDRFAKSLSSDDVPMDTNTVTISVIKTKDGWKIEPNKELYDAITGGFVSYVEKLGDDGIGGY